MTFGICQGQYLPLFPFQHIVILGFQPNDALIILSHKANHLCRQFSERINPLDIFVHLYPRQICLPDGLRRFRIHLRLNPHQRYFLLDFLQHIIIIQFQRIRQKLCCFFFFFHLCRNNTDCRHCLGFGNADAVSVQNIAAFRSNQTISGLLFISHFLPPGRVKHFDINQAPCQHQKRQYTAEQINQKPAFFTDRWSFHRKLPAFSNVLISKYMEKARSLCVFFGFGYWVVCVPVVSVDVSVFSGISRVSITSLPFATDTPYLGFCAVTVPD